MEKHFILVHGTFVRNAPWASSCDSKLRRQLKEHYNANKIEAHFHSVCWSSWNLHHDRRSGRTGIEKKINEIVASRPPGEVPEIYLIGHSHGGSTIAYFLKELAQGSGKKAALAAAIKGAVFLSTPFFAIRPRPEWRAIWAVVYLGLLFPFALALVFTVACAAALYSAAFLEAYFSTPIALSLPSVAIAAMVALVGRRLVRQSTVTRFYEMRQSFMEKQFEEIETCNLPRNTRCLFLRSSGDEVAILLAAAQLLVVFINRISFILLFPFFVMLRWWRRMLLSRFGLASFTAFIFLAIVGLGIELFFVFDLPWVVEIPSLDVLWTKNLKAISFFLEEGAWYSYRFAVGVFGVASLVAGFLAVMTIGLLFAMGAFQVGLFLFSSVILLMAPGIDSFRTAFFGEFSIEPVPYDQFSYFHCRWRENEQHQPGLKDAFALNHGGTYENDDALDRICMWLREAEMTEEV